MIWWVIDWLTMEIVDDSMIDSRSGLANRQSLWSSKHLDGWSLKSSSKTGSHSRVIQQSRSLKYHFSISPFTTCVDRNFCVVGETARFEGVRGRWGSKSSLKILVFCRQEADRIWVITNLLRSQKNNPSPEKFHHWIERQYPHDRKERGTAHYYQLVPIMFNLIINHLSVNQQSIIYLLISLLS